MSATPLLVQLRRLGAQAGIDLSERQVAQLGTYLRLLAQWNRKINLTALPLEDFPPASLDRLIAEPLRAAARLQGATFPWLDLGSGGGSPAIPIGVALPDCPLTMVESRSRKAAFLREAGRACELAGAEVHTGRIEELPLESGRTWGGVSLRAVRLDQGISKTLVDVTSERGVVVIFGPTDWSGLRPQFEQVSGEHGIIMLRRVELQ